MNHHRRAVAGLLRRDDGALSSSSAPSSLLNGAIPSSFSLLHSGRPTRFRQAYLRRLQVGATRWRASVLPSGATAIAGLSRRTFGPRQYELTTTTRQFSATVNPEDDAPQARELLPVSKLKPIQLHELYRLMNLETFRRDELARVFDEIVGISCKDETSDFSDCVLTRQKLGDYILASLIKDADESRDVRFSDEYHEELKQFATDEAGKLLRVLSERSRRSIEFSDDDDDAISKLEFVDAIAERAEQVDVRRTWPVVLSMFLVGSSVGITSPAFPFIVQDLGLSTSQYGAIISAFALSKMLGNLPSAIAVERHGRKPYLTTSLALIAAATAGVGVAGSFEELYLTRLMAGLGVAALSTGATMMLTDVSTPLNRASTIAPTMSAFSAGTALGPAIGGWLVDNVGLHSTFYVVGLCFSGVAGLNQLIIQETKPAARRIVRSSAGADEKQESIAKSVRNAVAQWGPLWNNSNVRGILLMNGAYWLALAGSQMTLLPLILTNEQGMAMSATQVGHVYAAMSLVQIVGNPVFARITDRVGKVPAVVAGCSLISASMAGFATLSQATASGDLTLYLALGTWAAGSSMLSTAPIAYISDKVDDKKRAQALALLRTWGDVGFLLGASGTGLLADYLGSCEGAMQSSSAVLMTATVWFALRQNVMGRAYDLVTASGSSGKGGQVSP